MTSESQRRTRILGSLFPAHADFQPILLLDAYREGIIELDELREQKAKVAKCLHVAKAKQKAIQNAQEGSGTPNISLSELLQPFTSVP